MRRALILATLALAPTPAFAQPAPRERVFIFHDWEDDVRPPPVPIRDGLDRVLLGDLRLAAPPPGPRIIDVDRMTASDCRLDLARGGRCTMSFEPEPIALDLERFARVRAARYELQLLEHIVDSVESAP